MLALLIVFTGLMAGVYFAFSAFIMQAFGQLPALQAGQAMNKINAVIVKTVFLPIFVGSTLWYAGLIVWALLYWQPITSWLLISASAIYIFGMFFVTIFGNVPLNNILMVQTNTESGLASYWQSYQDKWLTLNHIRTLSCIAACSLLSIAITGN